MFFRKNTAILAALALTAPFTIAQDDCDSEDIIEVAGSWTDNYGSDHEIDNETWVSGGFGYSSTYWVGEFDNDANYVVAQNDSENDWNADKWSRFDWTEADADGTWYYCQTAYDAETMDDALNTPAADSGDLDSGCGGFPWSSMSN